MSYDWSRMSQAQQFNVRAGALYSRLSTRHMVGSPGLTSYPSVHVDLFVIPPHDYVDENV